MDVSRPVLQGEWVFQELGAPLIPNRGGGVFAALFAISWQGACVGPAGNGREITAEFSYLLIVFDPLANRVISKEESS